MKSKVKLAFVILLCHLIGCKKNNEEPKPFRASFQAAMNKVQFSCEQSDDYRLAGGGSFMNNINGTDSAGFAVESGGQPEQSSVCGSCARTHFSSNVFCR